MIVINREAQECLNQLRSSPIWIRLAKELEQARVDMILTVVKPGVSLDNSTFQQLIGESELIKQIFKVQNNG